MYENKWYYFEYTDRDGNRWRCVEPVRVVAYVRRMQYKAMGCSDISDVCTEGGHFAEHRENLISEDYLV